MEKNIQYDTDVKYMLDKVFAGDKLELDCSNLHNLLVSLNSSELILKYAVDCREYVSQPRSKRLITVRNKRFAHRFVNPTNSKFYHDRSMTDHRERIQRAIIMEYFHPGYLQDILLPYIAQNSEGDINRVKNSLFKIQSIYKDNEVETAEKVFATQIALYYDTINIYKEDWSSHFQAVRTIVAEVKHNEQLSLPTPSTVSF